MSKGFEDDFAISAPNGDGKKDAVELTDREIAIAQGRDPEAVDEPEEEAEEEADDTEVDGKDAADSSSTDSEWIDDSVKELAGSYGIDDDSLKSFRDAKDFQKFATILEKTLGAAPAKTETKEESKPEPKEEAKAGDELDVKFFEEEGYDEHTLKLVKSVAQGQEVIKGLVDRISQLESRLQEADKKVETDVLNRDIDELGGRFGKSDSLTSGQQKAREKLVDSISLVKASMEKRGEKATSAVVLRRAELLAFGEEILAEETAKQKEALSQSVRKQSAKRRSVGRNTKPPARAERPGEARDPVKAIANDPALVAFWNDAQD